MHKQTRELSVCACTFMTYTQSSFGTSAATKNRRFWTISGEVGCFKVKMWMEIYLENCRSGLLAVFFASKMYRDYPESVVDTRCSRPAAQQLAAQAAALKIKTCCPSMADATAPLRTFRAKTYRWARATDTSASQINTTTGPNRATTT